MAKQKRIIVKTDERRGLEFFYNAAGRLVCGPMDQNRDYRREELHPDVLAELDEARCCGWYPSKAHIDSCIQLQQQHPAKAAAYVRYKLLGTATYADVFGPAMQQRIHEAQTDRLEKKLDQLSQDLRDLGQLVTNMAVAAAAPAYDRQLRRVK